MYFQMEYFVDNRTQRWQANWRCSYSYDNSPYCYNQQQINGGYSNWMPPQLPQSAKKKCKKSAKNIKNVQAINLANSAKSAVLNTKKLLDASLQTPSKLMPAVAQAPAAAPLKNLVIEGADFHDPEYLESLLKRFPVEIKQMQSRIKTAAPAHSNQELIVAKIRLANGEIITEAVFNFIRTELIGWIGVYQARCVGTPIFHSMSNNDYHITMVCSDVNAYRCLEECIDEIYNNEEEQDNKHIQLLRVPAITTLVYCLDAVYEQVVGDPAVFIDQLQLHKPKLRTNCWVVASHKVLAEEQKTQFTFLADERSVMYLNFVYGSTFYVCLQTATFRNRGIVTENDLNKI